MYIVQLLGATKRAYNIARQDAPAVLVRLGGIPFEEFEQRLDGGETVSTRVYGKSSPILTIHKSE